MSQRDFQVKWGASLKKETAYGTALADGDFTMLLPFLGPDLIDTVPTYDTDADEYGKGHPYPTRQDVLKWDAPFKRRFKCSVEALGWLASLALGNVATTQPNVDDNPTVYLHTMKPFVPSSSNDMPSTSIVEQTNDFRTKKYPGVVVASLMLSGEGVNWVNLEADLYGSGKRAAFAGSIPALTVVNYLRTHEAKLELGPYGDALVDISDQLKKWSLKWDNAPELEDGYFPSSGTQVDDEPSSGAVRGRCERGTPKLDFSITFRVNSDAHKQHLEDNDYMALKLTLSGEVITAGQPELFQAVIDLYKIGYAVAPIGIENGMQVYNITANTFYDESVSKILQLAVQNKHVAYLV